jgi:hypothetical protein
MGKTMAEGGLVQTRAFLASAGLLTVCGTFGGIPTPPGGGFSRFQFI